MPFPLVEVEDVPADDRDAALAALLAAGRRRLSVVDLASFGVMRRLGIRRYLGVDSHFAEQGFVPIAKMDE